MRDLRHFSDDGRRRLQTVQRQLLDLVRRLEAVRSRYPFRNEAGLTPLRVRLGLLVALTGAAAALGASCGSSGQPRPIPVHVIQTSDDLTQRLAHLSDLRFGAAGGRGMPVIHVNDGARYQRVFGAGAAITDTSAWLLEDRLSPATRARVMAALFADSGIRLGFVRVPIGASDFTKDGHPYSYDDLRAGQSDPTLSRFSVSHDDAYIVPILRQMLALNPHVHVIASPWSPPAWMKANGSLGNAGNRGTLLASAYDPLARYFVKFLQAYHSRGVRIDAVTPQNEPGQPTTYPGLNLSEPSEAAFIAHHLAPAIRAAGLHTAIYGHDFKWLFSPRVQALVSHPSVASSLAGIAWHCYDGNPVVMTVLHRAHPRLDQIEDECSSGIAPGPPAELLIASFRNWASAVVLWNLALDLRGGPVQPPNHGCGHCTGVLTIDEHEHTVRYSSDYYQLGQFTAFVRPGALRIGTNTFVTYNTPTPHNRVNYAKPGLDDVAFINPDGSKVLLAHNNGARATRFAVQWRGRGFTYRLPAGATVTFTWG